MGSRGFGIESPMNSAEPKRGVEMLGGSGDSASQVVSILIGGISLYSFVVYIPS